MIGKGAAFYKLFDILSFGPMDPEHLRSWVNHGMEGGGVRHQDVARLARKTFQLAREEGEADAGIHLPATHPA